MRGSLACLQWPEEINKKSYLGKLKTVFGRSSKTGRKSTYLSAANKKVLLKSIIQAILINIMSCFKFPIGLCNKL